MSKVKHRQNNKLKTETENKGPAAIGETCGSIPLPSGKKLNKKSKFFLVPITSYYLELYLS